MSQERTQRMLNLGCRKQIFLGAGEHSEAACYRLHHAVDEALNIISAIQQGLTPNEEHCLQVEMLARQVYTALSGNLIVETKSAER